MKTLQILSVSLDATNVKRLTNELDHDRFAITTVDSDEAAVEKCFQGNVDVVITGKELSDEAVKKLKAVFGTSSTDTIIIPQENNNVEDMERQLKEIYLRKQKESLQHIAVNDTTDAKNLEEDIRVV